MAFVSEINERLLIQDKCGAHFVVVNGWLCYGSTNTTRAQLWPMPEVGDLIKFLQEQLGEVPPEED